MGWMGRTRAAVRRVVHAGEAREAALQRITLFTEAEAPWPSEEIQVVFGEVSPTTERALRWLRLEALRVGADAVVNVEVQRVIEQGYSRAGRPKNRPSADALVRGPQHLATGTAVRKARG